MTEFVKIKKEKIKQILASFEAYIDYMRREADYLDKSVKEIKKEME